MSGQRDAAADAHEAAVRTLGELERRAPHPLRRRAHRRHRQELARARGSETFSSQRLDALEQRTAELREQLERERNAVTLREAAMGPETIRHGRRAQRLSRLGLERTEGVLERALTHDRGIGR